MPAATRARVTQPIYRPEWSKPPKPPVPAMIDYCPECDRPVHDLSPSPTRKPHVVRCIPCGDWLAPDEADELGR